MMDRMKIESSIEDIRPETFALICLDIRAGINLMLCEVSNLLIAFRPLTTSAVA